MSRFAVKNTVDNGFNLVVNDMVFRTPLVKLVITPSAIV